MFSPGMRTFLSELPNMRGKARWSMVRRAERLHVAEGYRKIEKEFPELKDGSGYEAMLMFEPIGGFLNDSRESPYISVLDVEIEQNTFAQGYSYLTDNEKELILTAANGDYDFSRPHFMRYGLTVGDARSILAAYLRRRLLDKLSVMF